MNDWIADSMQSRNTDFMLQMDIEGHEYKSMNSMSSENLMRFRIIIVEFHGLNFMRGHKITTFNRILDTHRCVHIHPINAEPVYNCMGMEIPNLMEFTFLRKDRITEHSDYTTFPHTLDADNTSNPSVVLPKAWHR